MNLSQYSQPYSFLGNSNIGILLIHGFTSTTSSMMYLAEKFSEKGLHIELPSLPGHGTTWQELARTTYQQWLDHLEVSLGALQKRCEKVFVCGLSLGGGLALRLLELHPELSGAIIINHACKFTHPKFWFVPLLKLFLPSTPAIASDIKDPATKEIGYTRTPTRGSSSNVNTT